MASSQKTHSTIWILLAVAATLTSIALQGLYLKDVVFNDTYGAGKSTDLFEAFPTEITPSKWTLDLSFVFFLQVGWLGHVLINILRRSDDGPFYKNPRIVSALFLLVFSVGVLLNILCVYLGGIGQTEVTLALWILVWLAYSVAMVDFYHRINRHVKNLAEEHKIDLLLFRILLQNGLSLYIAWCMISTLLNLTIVMKYSFNMDMSTACSLTLIKMGLEFLVFLALDLWFFERYFRYTFTPYVAFIWALSGALAAHWDPNMTHSTLTVVVLAECILGLLMKVVSTIVRANQQPLYESMP